VEMSLDIESSATAAVTQFPGEDDAQLYLSVDDRSCISLL